MKKLVVILALLLIVQTYGVYGAMQAKRVVFTCTTEIGVLCFAWEENVLAKVLGADEAAALEDSLSDARDVWEEKVAAKIAKKKTKGTAELKKILDSAGQSAASGLEKAKKAAAEAIEKATE